VPTATVIDDDAAEGDTGTSSTKTARTAKHQNRGQNKARKFHFAQDEVKLCQSLSHVLREGLFESTPCSYAISKEGGRNTKVGDGGDSDRTVAPKCRFEHNLREYLKHKTNSAEGVCEIWKERGVCASGWRCRWLGTHSREENGELVLLIDEEKKKAVERQAGHLKMGKIAASKSEVGKTVPLDWEKNIPIHGFDNPYGEIVNNVPVEVKIQIRKARFPLKKSLVYQAWVDKVKDQESEDKAGERAAYREPPPKPEEKRKLYIGRDTPLLAPLTFVIPLAGGVFVYVDIGINRGDTVLPVICPSAVSA
jgi:tRNA-dihydrouridine synthase 3